MFLPLISQLIPIFCGQKAEESARKYLKWMNVLPFEVQVQERFLAFFQFANSVTFKGHSKEFSDRYKTL